MKRKWSSSLEIGSTSNEKSGARFDVFLGFRGSDTRLNFTNSLYHALLDKGIRVFLDTEGIECGKEISHEIFQAINDSKICIPILSTGYASSRWCLRELEHMMKHRKSHGLEVKPIFYDVEPSVVKLEPGVYREALIQHENERGAEAVQGWKEALKEVTELAGWKAENRGHGELTREIALDVFGKLGVSPVHLPDSLVGINSSVDKVIDLLSVESKDIKLLGICGISGIGKTTLAKIVYKKLSAHFQSCSFVHDIRQASESSSFGLLGVQRKLVHDILMEQRTEILNIDEGKNMIRKYFSEKKVFIVLDDVNNETQLTELAIERKSFGSGSRILVTTRDQKVLSKFENSLIHEVEGLNTQESLELFSKHVFGSNSHLPPSDFLSLSNKVIAKVGGIPLIIEVIGSLLRGQEKVVWEDILEKMEKYRCKDVLQHLKLSYTKLNKEEQKIFLDIATFLAGKNMRDATYMWKDCTWFPRAGIITLLSRSLVKIREKDELWMHDQLKDLGRSIILDENENDPGKRSRVWNHEEALHMITSKEGTETVQAICVDSKGISLASEDFKEMPNIRFLEMTSGNLSGEFKDLFQQLKWLSWKNCPSILQATHFFPKNLLILDLSRTGITQHWNGWTQLEVATRLKVLNLSSCKMLKEIPILSAFLSLEILILERCTELTKLPNSIEMLQYLVELDVSITSIEELPDTIVNLKSLKVLKMNYSGMQKLPEAIGMMEKLEEIHGNVCEALEMIPSDIVRLSSLKILTLTETGVENIPELPQSLVSLCLSSSAPQKVPEIFNLVNRPGLRNLYLSFEGDDFEGNDLIFVESDSELVDHAFDNSLSMILPSSEISFGGWLRCTRELELFKCKNLCRIQQLPFDLRKLEINECNLLEAVDFSNLENLLELSLYNNEIYDIRGLEHLASLRCLRVDKCNSSNFSGLEKLKNLRLLQLECCPSLQTLPNLSNLKNLKEFKLSDCLKLVEIEGLDTLESLETLDIQHCSSLVEIEGLHALESLETLDIQHCSSLRSLADLSHLKKLKNLCQIQQLPSSLRDLKISDCGLLEVVLLSNLENLLSLSLINIPICDIQGIEGLASLKHLSVDNCKSSKFSGLERLKHLRFLQLRICPFLQTLPNLSNLKNLQDFLIWNCSKLVEIEGLEGLESLQTLDIQHCSSLRSLSNLSHLKKMKNPRQIQQLPSGLRKLEISHCSLLEVVDLSNLENLLYLLLLENPICDIQGFDGLASLQHLRVYNCKSSNFNGLERLKYLRVLQLRMCPFLQTLCNVSNLKDVKYFELWDCPNLVEIEGLDRLESLEALDIQRCSSLRSLVGLSHLKKLKNLCQIQQLPSGLKRLDIRDCSLLEVVDLSNLKNLLYLSLIKNPICDIQGLEGLASLQDLSVDNCKSSKFSGLERLKYLQFLHLRMCPFLQTLPNLSNLKDLVCFELCDCPNLVEIVGLDRLESLKRLDIRCCSSLQSLPDLSHLKNLKMNCTE